MTGPASARDNMNTGSQRTVFALRLSDHMFIFFIILSPIFTLEITPFKPEHTADRE